tara:strand:+ start:7933 stop:8178 length:246 start_codon:yes stop_codon:yes gene_type:complete
MEPVNVKYLLEPKERFKSVALRRIDHTNEKIDVGCPIEVDGSYCGSWCAQFDPNHHEGHQLNRGVKLHCCGRVFWYDEMEG